MTRWLVRFMRHSWSIDGTWSSKVWTCSLSTRPVSSILAMALERWLLVCRPSTAQTTLRGRRGSLIRIGLPVLSILLAVYLLVDLLRFEVFEEQEDIRFTSDGGSSNYSNIWQTVSRSPNNESCSSYTQQQKSSSISRTSP